MQIGFQWWQKAPHIVSSFVCLRNMSVCRFVALRIALAGVTSHVDDEYRWAGVEDPRIMVTTSRDPSSRLKMFAKVSWGRFSKKH